MRATIKELRRTMFDIDFDLIVNNRRLNNSEGRRFLYEIENQELEVEFYIGSAGVFVIETEIKKTEDLITDEVKKVAKEKALKMPMGTYSRLQLGNKFSDIVISPTSYGIWFYNEPNAIGKDISSKIVCFISYEDLK